MRYLANLSLLLVAFFLCAVVGSGVAHADTTFDITGTFTNGTTLSGTFAIDTTGKVTAVDMTLAGPYASGPYSGVIQGPETSLTPSFYHLAVFDSQSDVINLDFPQVTLVGYAGGELCGINSGSCLITAPTPGILESDFFIQGSGANPTSLLDTGSVSQALEPSSLLLLSTGVIGGIGAMRRRFRGAANRGMKVSAPMLTGTLLMVALAPSSQADSVYTYVSTPSISCASGPCPTTLSISVDTDLSVNQLENLSDTDIGPLNSFFHVVSFAVTDSSGLAINSNNGGVLDNFIISTDGSGDITNWIFFVQAQPGQPLLGSCNKGSDPRFQAQASATTCNFGPTIEFSIAAGWYSTSVSTWSAPTPTPEPSSVMLLGTGLIGGIGAMRRKLLDLH